MTGTDVRWAGVEVAVSRQPDDPDGFRVVFERAGPEGKAKLATVYVDGGEDPDGHPVRPAGRGPSGRAGPGRVRAEGRGGRPEPGRSAAPGLDPGDRIEST